MTRPGLEPRPRRSYDISEVCTASIIRAWMMEAVRTSETSVTFNVATRRYIPEDSKLHTRRHGNLKSRKEYSSLFSEHD
jgi:hypothetical protein